MMNRDYGLLCIKFLKNILKFNNLWNNISDIDIGV